MSQISVFFLSYLRSVISYDSSRVLQRKYRGSPHAQPSQSSAHGPVSSCAFSKNALKASVAAYRAMSDDDTSRALATRSIPARGTGFDHAVT